MASRGPGVSSNPGIKYVNQRGQTFAYSPSSASICFESASGVYFAPWTMTGWTVYSD
jgi:hypothetical protein